MFIGAISAAYVTQINMDVRGNVVALSLAIIQVFLCFIFHKIDIRNKFLIKHTEKIIKTVESDFEEDVPRVFITEEQLTKKQRLNDKRKVYFLRQLSTSQLYNLFYIFFAVAGIIEIMVMF